MLTVSAEDAEVLQGLLGRASPVYYDIDPPDADVWHEANRQLTEPPSTFKQCIEGEG